MSKHRAAEHYLARAAWTVPRRSPEGLPAPLVAAIAMSASDEAILTGS